MGNILLVPPVFWTMVFLVAVIFFVFATIKAAKIICVFTGNDILSNGRWFPTQRELRQKSNAEHLLRLSRFFIYAVIYIYLVKVKMLFSLMLVDQLKLLCVYYVSAIVVVYAFVFIVTNVITAKYINKIK